MKKVYFLDFEGEVKPAEEAVEAAVSETTDAAEGEAETGNQVYVEADSMKQALAKVQEKYDVTSINAIALTDLREIEGKGEDVKVYSKILVDGCEVIFPVKEVADIARAIAQDEVTVVNLYTEKATLL